MAQPRGPLAAAHQPLPLEPRAGPDGEETEQDIMMRRLWKSDELIKQLKHIVKAQHGKIEELRDRLDFDPTGAVRGKMAAQDLANFARVKEDNEELRRQVHRLKGEVGRMKGETETLRKANSRLKRMLNQQQPISSPEEDSKELDEAFSTSRSTAPIGSAPDSARSAPATSSSVAPGHTGQAPCPVLSSTRDSVNASAGRAASSVTSPAKRPCTSSGRAAAAAGLPGFSKLWRLSSVVPMFWRDLDSPGTVLDTLVEIAGRLLSDGPSSCITVYMLDDWLRSTALAPTDGQPILFYLGAGKTTVQVFHASGPRAEPPKFGDLQALPTRSRGSLAVAVQMPTSHTRLAVLQVVSTEEPKEKRSPPQTPKALQGRLGRDSPEAQEPSGFTDSQLMYLQLVCNVAGGVLEQLKDGALKQRLLDRMHSCVDVSGAINQARSLPDFEQRVKHLLGEFFGVTTVRVLFYDSETNELLISSAQMRRKGVSKLPLDKGVVGLCAKRQAVVHVANISHHPYIDATADGLQRTGRPVAAEAAMLVGPLVIESVEGSRLVGVVQLLERQKKNGPVDVAEKDDGFSAEEQNLFTQLLRVCAQAAWRTYKVQELTAQVNNSQTGLMQMLSG